jgi:hypothetical protein
VALGAVLVAGCGNAGSHGSSASTPGDPGASTAMQPATSTSQATPVADAGIAYGDWNPAVRSFDRARLGIGRFLVAFQTCVATPNPDLSAIERCYARAKRPLEPVLNAAESHASALRNEAGQECAQSLSDYLLALAAVTRSADRIDAALRQDARDTVNQRAARLAGEVGTWAQANNAMLQACAP